MGMNLYGLAPKDHIGKIYRLSIWLWHPLWNYVEKEYPDIAAKVGNGHANNGDLVSEDIAKEILDMLSEDMFNGKIADYITNFNNFLNSLPEVTCEYCLGFGKEIEFILNITEVNCFRCSGSGISKMFITNYKADMHDFYRFKDFLENCGGFKIL
jgi:hypothetical protein